MERALENQAQDQYGVWGQRGRWQYYPLCHSNTENILNCRRIFIFWDFVGRQFITYRTVIIIHTKKKKVCESHKAQTCTQKLVFMSPCGSQTKHCAVGTQNNFIASILFIQNFHCAQGTVSLSCLLLVDQCHSL